MSVREVQMGDETIRLEPFSGLKAVRVIRTIERITKGVPEILERWAEFTRNYEASNVTEVDRAFARVRYSPDPLMEEEPIIEGGQALTDDLGRTLVRRTPRLVDGVPVMGPDPLGHMTEADWEASGNKLRIPKSPSTEERVAAIFPMALDLAEQETLQLLALIAMPERDLLRYWREGSLFDEPGEEPLPREKWGALRQRGEELLIAPADHIIDLAIAAGDVVDGQFVQKVARLREGGALGNVLRLFGMSPKSQTSSAPVSETTPTSSTDSELPTGGERSKPSEPAGTSSVLSPSG